MTDVTKAKTNFRAECSVLAQEVPGLVLVPGMDPDGRIIGYTKLANGNLVEWGDWPNWRDAYNYLSGYNAGHLDGKE